MSKMRIAIASVFLGLCVAACGGSSPEPAEPAHPVEPGAADDAAAIEPVAPQFELSNPAGDLVAVEDVLVPGQVTVVDFYADWCAPCKVLEKKLAGEIHQEPRISVRKIDVGQAEPEAVTAQYGIENLPHVRIYDPEGKLLHDLPGTAAERTGALALEALGDL
ncbi:thioredoxin family protein [Haliangium ochraceum]|nr:thioredoxin family protein [Haliangium ochraceum]